MQKVDLGGGASIYIYNMYIPYIRISIDLMLKHTDEAYHSVHVLRKARKGKEVNRRGARAGLEPDKSDNASKSWVLLNLIYSLFDKQAFVITMNVHSFG